MNQNKPLENQPQTYSPKDNSASFVIVDYSNSSASSAIVDNSSVSDCLGNLMKNAILVTEIVPSDESVATLADSPEE
jgi:hypothetical protein